MINKNFWKKKRELQILKEILDEGVKKLLKIHDKSNRSPL